MISSEFDTLAGLINDLARCGKSVFKRQKPFYRWQLWQHLARVGTDSIPIVSVIAICAGVILALQSAQQLEKVGALSYVANLVGVTIISELGPLLTSVILAGRSGAAFTAEIATMKISQELDALEVIGVDPILYLVWPKLVAMVIMVPILTLLADFMGIMAGALFSASFLGLHLWDYFDQTATFLQMADLVAGLIKGLGFGITIAVVGCWQGLLARDGAADVGVRTTKSVVMSIFLIILLDLFFTALNYGFR